MAKAVSAANGAGFTIWAKVAGSTGITSRAGKAAIASTGAIAGDGILAVAMLTAIRAKFTIRPKAAAFALGAIGSGKSYGAFIA